MKIIPKKVTQSCGRQILKTKKNSPHIFFVGGVIGVGVSTVLACRATLKLEETVDEINVDLKNVKELGETTVQDPSNDYTERDYYKDLGYVYGRSGAKLARLYGPSALVGAVSIAALTGSHVQLTRRNTALTAAFAAVSKAYEDYRGRVQEELGTDRELELYRAVREEEIEKDGKKKETVPVVDPNGFSPYAQIFDEKNPNFQKNAELNRIFIQCQQNYFNQKLVARGHVFLNEVYDALGFERTHAGQVVGWVLDGDGDDYIDFGLFEAHAAEFINGYEPRIVLDFNVDGIVYDKF